jgi:hypothetical protein
LGRGAQRMGLGVRTTGMSWTRVRTSVAHGCPCAHQEQGPELHAQWEPSRPRPSSWPGWRLGPSALIRSFAYTSAAGKSWQPLHRLFLTSAIYPEKHRWCREREGGGRLRKPKPLRKPPGCPRLLKQTQCVICNHNVNR